jgi:hypothetical protein
MTAERDEHLQILLNDDLRLAYEVLEWAGLSSGHHLRYTVPPVPSVDYFDARGDWRFSFIPNQRHLLFYLRHPALNSEPELKSQAAAIFCLKQNRAEEGQIYIRTARDARAVASWFFR